MFAFTFYFKWFKVVLFLFISDCDWLLMMVLKGTAITLTLIFIFINGKCLLSVWLLRDIFTLRLLWFFISQDLQLVLEKAKALAYQSWHNADFSTDQKQNLSQSWLGLLTFSRALHWSHIFPRFVHRLHVFPRFVHRLHVFPRFVHRLHIFPRFAPVACFPALGNRCRFLPRLMIGSNRRFS